MLPSMFPSILYSFAHASVARRMKSRVAEVYLCITLNGKHRDLGAVFSLKMLAARCINSAQIFILETETYFFCRKLF